MPPLFLALLAFATAAAFGYTQRLKREPLVIDRTEFVARGARPGTAGQTVFTPNGDCRRDRMIITFRTTRRDRGNVAVIRLGGSRVRWLVRNKFFGRYVEHRLSWDGNRDNGRPAPAGAYLVRVKMRHEGRVVYLPGRIHLRRVPPGEYACRRGSPKAARP